MYATPQPRPRRTAFQEVGGALDVLTGSVSEAVDTFLASVSEAPVQPRSFERPHRRVEDRDCGCGSRKAHHHDTRGDDCACGHSHGSRVADECGCAETHGCSSCGDDRCHCRCCIGDADLLVYSRLFEMRVVPIQIENRRRRAREIRLELSAFRRSGGGLAPVWATVLAPTSFTLEPCSSKTVTLVIGSRSMEDGSDAGFRAGFDAIAVTEEEGIELPDVDDCLVAYADLRVEGCDIRPIRIAVALLPRDCGAYEVECSCSCC